MQFTVLGSGTHFPDPARRSSGYLLHDGKHLIQFDFGYGTLLRLVEMKVKYQNIGHIFFTHLHEDHYLDFLPFLNTLRIQTALWGLSSRTIEVFGPAGTRKKLNQVIAATGMLPARGIHMQIRELGKSTVRIRNLMIRAHPVHHLKGINALCYRVEKKNKKSIVYTGDLDYDVSIIPFLKGVHTLVIECGFPDQMKREGHLTPREAGKIAHKAGVARVVLTHRYPPCDHADVARQCTREFTGAVILARDHLRITA